MNWTLETASTQTTEAAGGADAEAAAIGLDERAERLQTSRFADAGESVRGAVITETPFLPATLSGSAPPPPLGGPFDGIGEARRLQDLCTFIQANGSGFGICSSCRLGGLGAGRL